MCRVSVNETVQVAFLTLPKGIGKAQGMAPTTPSRNSGCHEE